MLAEMLAPLAEITVVAPERDRSGSSNSLTLDRPLSVRQASERFYYVNGTPTDCVHLAVTGLLKELPDIVISGINHGANMGDDTIYSGTVAAATEGFLLGIPSIAISLAASFDSAGGDHFADRGAGRGGSRPAVPAPPAGRCRVAQCQRSRCRSRAPARHAGHASGQAAQGGAGGEIRHAARRDGVLGRRGRAARRMRARERISTRSRGNRVSITPLQMDLTRYAQLDTLGAWLASDGAR